MTPREDAATTYALVVIGACLFTFLYCAVRNGIDRLLNAPRPPRPIGMRCGNPACAVCNKNPEPKR